MARTRANAIVDQSTQLDMVFLLNGQPFDPFEVRQVEILAADKVTVLEIIPSGSISNIAVGCYRITAAAISGADVYFDNWFWTPTNVIPEQQQLDTFIVFAQEPSGSVIDDVIEEIRYDIGDEAGSLITDVGLKVIIGKAVTFTNKKLRLTGTSDAIQYDGNIFNAAFANEDIRAILLMQAECLTFKRFQAKAASGGISIKRHRTSIDTTKRAQNQSEMVNGTNSVCNELKDCVKQYLLTRGGAGTNGRGVY